MTKGKPKVNTKRRAKPQPLTSDDHKGIVFDYADGTLSVSEIAKKYSTTDKNVGLIVNRHWKALTNMRESRALLSQDPNLVNSKKSNGNGVAVVLQELEKVKEFNTEFTGLLSDPDAALLSDAEAIYCWTYVHSGDTYDAIRTAGLDAGLYKDKEEIARFSYDRAMKLRAMYLNNKPNVVSYIKELRETRLIDADVGKARLQSELLEQLDQMKSSGNSNKFRSQILKTIELLGKTVGAFTERIEIHEVDPANALDQLIEMAQEASVREITQEEPSVTTTEQ